MLSNLVSEPDDKILLNKKAPNRIAQTATAINIIQARISLESTVVKSKTTIVI